MEQLLFKRLMTQLTTFTMLTMMTSTYAKVYDLSHSHGPDTMMSTGSMPPYNYTTLFKGIHETGAYWDFGFYGSSEHGGTHMDAPKHKIEGGKSLDEIPIEDTVAEGVMIDCSKEAMMKHDYAVSVQKILDWEKENGDIPRDAAILVNFGWSSKFGNNTLYRGTSNVNDALAHKYPYVSKEAGEWLYNNRHPHILGTDTMSPDPFQINGKIGNFPVHHLYLANNILIIENLRDLGQLPARGFRFYSPPVKYVGATGAQVRAFAITHDRANNGAALMAASLLLGIPALFLLY